MVYSVTLKLEFIYLLDVIHLLDCVLMQISNQLRCY